MNQVALTSSFAGNIAQFAASPFLLLFSFLVALELAKRNEETNQDMTKLLQGNPPNSLLDWSVDRVMRPRYARTANGTRIAGIGALICLILTLLLLTGDKLLQGTLASTTQRLYSTNSMDPEFNSSFVINREICPRQQTRPDMYDGAVAPPCSIDNTTHPWTLVGASDAYRVLATGLLNQTSDFNKEDFNALSNASASGTFDWTQLVTYVDNITHDQHIFFFNPFWAGEDEYRQPHSKLGLVHDEVERSGYDFIANTSSVVTKCFPITVDCGMHTTNDNDSSIPYQCSDIFKGSLMETPANGVERLRGWNTTFFNFDNGSPRQLSIASQLNPFSYNVTAVVDSINIQGLERAKDPQVTEGTIIGIGDGLVGFALSCTSTIYDVTYSLVDGNIYVFNATKADPSIAAIIKAPLQAGFGSYGLFEKAAIAVLTNMTVVDDMELAFSQTLLGLAAGVFKEGPNVASRWRGDMVVTRIGKGPFYFLIVCMFLYAVVVVVFTAIAIILVQRNKVRELQARLLMKE